MEHILTWKPYVVSVQPAPLFFLIQQAVFNRPWKEGVWDAISQATNSTLKSSWLSISADLPVRLYTFSVFLSIKVLLFPFTYRPPSSYVVLHFYTFVTHLAIKKCLWQSPYKMLWSISEVFKIIKNDYEKSPFIQAETFFQVSMTASVGTAFSCLKWYEWCLLAGASLCILQVLWACCLSLACSAGWDQKWKG